ncbi:MAG: hypothetical protein H0X65_03935 [Gemmatimonadetes bacterium]|nr:hypothetical protein [Gemmatimonadota bacterium]
MMPAMNHVGRVRVGSVTVHGGVVACMRRIAVHLGMLPRPSRINLPRCVVLVRTESCGLVASGARGVRSVIHARGRGWRVPRVVHTGSHHWAGGVLPVRGMGGVRQRRGDLFGPYRFHSLLSGLPGTSATGGHDPAKQDGSEMLEHRWFS